jgi:D-alanyl-D-alanine dipeptidase
MKTQYLVILFILLTQISCTSPKTKAVTVEKPKVQEIPAPPVCQLEDSICNAGLINIQDINTDIRVYLRYSTSNNFLNQDMYGCLTNAYLHTIAAKKIDIAQQLLSKTDSSLHLLVWDAARPRSVQWKMWKALKMPLDQKKRFVSNPRNGSIHNYGCAVDLTICSDSGELLDMGTDFDYFGKAAGTRNEWSLVKEKIITPVQEKNRKLLRRVMKEAGFSTISSEWWHFNAMSRTVAKQLYPIVE